MAEPNDIPTSDDVRSLAKHFGGGSPERIKLAAIATQLDELPKLRQLAEQPPSRATGASMVHQPIEASLASLARSMEIIVEHLAKE